MGKYDDIINMPRHVSERHGQMPASERAAQFSPFAALTGHGEAIKETARLTSERIEPSEDQKAILDMKLRMLKDMGKEAVHIEVTYFSEDSRKAGGEYVTASGCIMGINDYERTMQLSDGTKIPMDDIIEIESDLFLGIIN